MRPAILLPAVLLASRVVSFAQPPSIAFDTPLPADVIGGEVDVRLTDPPEGLTWLEVVVYLDGREVCVLLAEPWRCSVDAGTSLAARHLRAVARTTDGRRAVANVRTTAMALDEAVRVDAVQVPALVTDRQGRFVRELTPAAFTVRDEGVVQRVDSLITEAMPLDLVLAVDISTSMDEAIGDVQEAVKRLLKRLEGRDTATILGFNDTLFLLADTESNPQARLDAVDGLVTWGGTALYDATVKAVDLVGRRQGRRGVVVFSDGDDRHSVGDEARTLQRIQESDVVLYTIGFGRLPTAALKRTLERFATASGGRAFFPQRTADLDAVFDTILEELSHQYVISYVPAQAGDAWRRLDVQVACDGCRVRARDGYRRAQR